MFEDEDFDEELFEEEDFDEYTGEMIDFNEYDNLIDYSNDEYCKTQCEFFKTCYANHNICIKEVFKNMLKTLTPREERVLKMRFGWYNNIRFPYSQIGLEHDITMERARQVEKKALRKSRHPSRSRKLKSFLYDVALLPDENFYKSLSLAIFGEFAKELVFEAELGMDYNIVDKEKTSEKSITAIKNELDKNIHDIEILRPFITCVDKLNIITLDHLLHTSELNLFACFVEDDKKLFELLKTLSDMGYRLKETCICSSKLNECYAKDLKDLIFNTSIFEERFLDLPSKIVFKLFEQGITTNHDLLTRIFFVKASKDISEEEMQIIDNYLESKKLLCYFNEDHTKKIYITSYLFNAFIDNLIVWLKNNCISISSLKNDLSKIQNISVISLYEMINTNFGDFKFSGFENPKNALLITSYIEELNLSVRAFNCLKRAGINTLQDLISLSKEDLTKIKNISPKALDEIIEKLYQVDLEIPD